jgi:hypothetical protein
MGSGRDALFPPHYLTIRRANPNMPTAIAVPCLPELRAKVGTQLFRR